MYYCIMLSFFDLIRIFQKPFSSSTGRSSICSSLIFWFFLLTLFMLKIQVKSSRPQIFFFVFNFYLFIFIIFQYKLQHFSRDFCYEIVQEMFCISIATLHLEIYVYTQRRFRYLVPINYINCLIQFSVYEAIFCIHKPTNSYKYFSCIIFYCI